MNIFKFDKPKFSTLEKALLITTISVFLGIEAALLMTKAPLGVNVFLVTHTFMVLNLFLRNVSKNKFFITRYDILLILMSLASISIMFHYEKSLQNGTIIFLMGLSLPSILLPFKSKIIQRFSFIENIFRYPIEAWAETANYFKYFEGLEIKGGAKYFSKTVCTW